MRKKIMLILSLCLFGFQVAEAVETTASDLKPQKQLKHKYIALAIDYTAAKTEMADLNDVINQFALLGYLFDVPTTIKNVNKTNEFNLDLRFYNDLTNDVKMLSFSYAQHNPGSVGYSVSGQKPFLFESKGSMHGLAFGRMQFFSIVEKKLFFTFSLHMGLHLLTETMTADNGTTIEKYSEKKMSMGLTGKVGFEVRPVQSFFLNCSVGYRIMFSFSSMPTPYPTYIYYSEENFIADYGGMVFKLSVVVPFR